MTHLKNDFAHGGPVSQVSADWLNAVANFINNIVPGQGVKFTKHLDGNATIVETDAASDVSQTITIGGAVTWTGTQLLQDQYSVVITNGVITSVTTTSAVVIDTAVTYNAS